MNDNEKELQNKLVILFKEEASEHLKFFSDGLFKLEKKPSEKEEKNIVQSLFRSAHSLKGAARAVNFLEIESLCAALEDVLDKLRNKELKTTDEFFIILYESTDILEKIIFSENEESKKSSLQSTFELAEKLEKLIEGKELEADLLPKNESAEQSRTKEPSNETFKPETPKKADTQEKNVEASLPENAKFQLSNAVPAKEIKTPIKNNQTETKNTHLNDSIRISSTKIDRLLQHVEEMLMIKLTSQQKIKEIEELHYLLTNWNKWNSQNDIEKIIYDLFSPRNLQKGNNVELMQQHLNEFNSYFEKKKEIFKNVIGNLTQLKRLCEQDHRMICSLVDSVIDDTKEILMQPFSILLEGFPKMVRELSQTLEKQVALEIIGDDIEVDRRILEQLKDPLIHILRNSVDHGIESSEERIQKNKNPKGSIIISTKQISGNSFEVKVSDDGKGIDFDRIKEKAIKEGLISEKDKASFTKENLINLIFSSGFSTSQIVTDISGRGVGLNVLAENVEKLGGTVVVESNLGEGTSFIITMPLTLATFRGIHVKVSNQEFIIPTHNVVRVFRGSKNDIKTIENQKIISFEDQTYSYVELADVLGVPAKKSEADADSLKPMLLIKASDVQIAFGADAIYNEQEVFVKGLGKQLKRVKNIAASTIMEWGKVIPILDPFDLIKTACQSSHTSVNYTIDELDDENAQKNILVIDDSITSRMLLKNILETAGYHVKSAVDGLEGFNILGREPFDLVLSDVEMPRMDGFELTKKIRSTLKFKDLPVILVTSRGSKEDRQEGIDSGANAYLDKSNFMQKNLLDVIDQLL